MAGKLRRLDVVTEGRGAAVYLLPGPGGRCDVTWSLPLFVLALHPELLSGYLLDSSACIAYSVQICCTAYPKLCRPSRFTNSHPPPCARRIRVTRPLVGLVYWGVYWLRRSPFLRGYVATPNSRRRKLICGYCLSNMHRADVRMREVNILLEVSHKI
jgi:hypothetical protein